MQDVLLLIMGLLIVFLDDWIVRSRVKKQGLEMTETQIRQAILGVRAIGIVFLLLFR